MHNYMMHMNSAEKVTINVNVHPRHNYQKKISVHMYPYKMCWVRCAQLVAQLAHKS